MKIIKNTTRYETRTLRTLICRVHAHMKKLERRPAPNWPRLRIAIGNRSRAYSGRAYFHGNGRGWGSDWDVYLSLPPDADERGTGSLVYHELMHTYGYRHGAYNDIPDAELAELFPENKPLGPPLKPKPKPKPKPVEYGKFPVKIRMTTRTMDELRHSEEGSWEDWNNGAWSPKEIEDEYPDGHPFEIAGRHKSVLEVRTLGEAETMYESLRSSTFSLHCPDACDRVMCVLAAHIWKRKEAS